MARAKKKIVALESGAVYSSVQAAAKALGVDPANIRKVLSGKRQSAGGLHFSDLTDVKRVTKQRIAKELSRYVEKGIDREVRKVLTKENRRLIQSTHDRLVSLNLMRRNALKENLLESDKVLQGIYNNVASEFGTTKTGGFITSPAYIRQFASELNPKTGRIEFNPERIKDLLDRIAKEQEDYIDDTYYSNKTKNRNIYDYATAHGITPEQAKKYWHILPTLYDMLEAAKINTEFKYSSILGDIESYMQYDADPDELLRFIVELKNVAKGNTKEDLQQVLDKWRSKTAKWGEPEEDEEEQDQEYEAVDDEFNPDFLGD